VLACPTRPTFSIDHVGPRPLRPAGSVAGRSTASKFALGVSVCGATTGNDAVYRLRGLERAGVTERASPVSSNSKTQLPVLVPVPVPCSTRLLSVEGAGMFRVTILRTPRKFANWVLDNAIFITRQHASAWRARYYYCKMCPSVRPVCLSHAGIVSKRMHRQTLSALCYGQDSSFLEAYYGYKIPKGTPSSNTWT